MASYCLLDAADEDLETIFLIGLEMFGYEQAHRYQRGIIAAFEMLAIYPRIARLREEISGAVRALPYKAHVMIYEFDDAGDVAILRIRHGHEDWLGDPI